MLNSTFVHTQGIGPKTEKHIWRSGLLTWDDFLARHSTCRLSERQQALLLPCIEESTERLAAGDYAYFAEALPSGERWRAFKEFGGKCAYVDIETVGTGECDAITVIGLYDGDKVRSYVKGFNLEAFVDDIAVFPIIVTFSGSSFDLPHIRRAFPELRLDQIHIDLCPTLRKLGLTGGLKKIEQAVGLRRPDEIAGMDGWDAVRLWNQWEWGSQEALDLLIEYNAYDVVNLKALAEKAYADLKAVAFDWE